MSQLQFVSIPEAGRRLGKSPQSIKRLIRRRKLSAIQIPGTHARIPASEVDAYLPAQLRAVSPAMESPVCLPMPA